MIPRQNQHDPSMKHIFSSVMVIGLLAWATVIRGEAGDGTSPRPQGHLLQRQGRGAANSQSLVTAAARNVQKEEAAISADMRLPRRCAGHQLLGTGNTSSRVLALTCWCGWN